MEHDAALSSGTSVQSGFAGLIQRSKSDSASLDALIEARHRQKAAKGALAIQRRKDERRKREKDAILRCATGFLDGQPDYQRIIHFWDPKSAEKPQTIYRFLSREVLHVRIESTDGAIVAVRLHFRNEHGVEFNDVFKLMLVRRNERWYVRRITQ